MKKYITVVLILISLSVKAQKIDLSRTYASEPIKMIITADAQPVDTTYTSYDNKAFQKVRFSYMSGKTKMQIIVTSYYNGKYWQFKGCDMDEFKNNNFLEPATHPIGLYLNNTSPLINY